MYSFSAELKRFIACIIYPILVCIVFFLVYRELSVMFYLDKLYGSISFSLIFTILIALPIAYSYAILNFLKTRMIWLRIILYYVVITTLIGFILLYQEGYIIVQSSPVS